MQSEAAVIDPAEGRGRSLRAFTSAHERLLWPAIGALSAFSILLLSRPYRGIIHDSQIYIGRALADADPDGLGRDILFAFDGQSQFSLFPRMAGLLLGALGPSTTAAALSVLGLVVWFAGLGAFASRLARGRLLWAMLVFAAILPAYYGSSLILRYGEQFATPRPFAEALVLASFGALLSGRRWLALLAILAAGLMHPIMAAPGLGVWLLVQSAADRRWLWASLAGLATLVLAGAAGFPFAKRLFVLIDPEWQAAISANAYLFPSNWRVADWTNIVVRSVTVAIAALLVPQGRVRALLLSALAIGLSGLALACLAGDIREVLLVVQMQPWRALWLISALSGLLLPVVIVGLWRLGPTGRVAVAALVFAWLATVSPPAALAGAGLAMLLAFRARHAPNLFGPFFVGSALATLLTFALMFWLQRVAFTFELWSSKPDGAALTAQLWGFWVFTLPIAAAVMAWVAFERFKPGPLPAIAAATGLVALAALFFDDRPAASRRFDQHIPDPGLVRLLPREPGEILWLRNGGYQAWSRAGRRNWVSYLQGASMIFSRELSLLWEERSNRLVAAGLADQGDRFPMLDVKPVTLRPSARDIASICTAPDGPVALVFPVDEKVVLPDGIAVSLYRSPWPDFRIAELDGGGAGWKSASDLAIVDCTAMPGFTGIRSTGS